MPMLRMPHARAIPRQQSCCVVGCIANRQAEAGIAVHETINASNKNAPFLRQFMPKGPRLLIISICRRLWGGSDIDHMRGTGSPKAFNRQRFVSLRVQDQVRRRNRIESDDGRFKPGSGLRELAQSTENAE